MCLAALYKFFKVTIAFFFTILFQYFLRKKLFVIQLKVDFYFLF